MQPTSKCPEMAFSNECSSAMQSMHMPWASPGLNVKGLVESLSSMVIRHPSICGRWVTCTPGPMPMSPYDDGSRLQTDGLRLRQNESSASCIYADAQSAAVDLKDTGLLAESSQNRMTRKYLIQLCEPRKHRTTWYNHGTDVVCFVHTEFLLDRQIGKQETSKPQFPRNRRNAHQEHMTQTAIFNCGTLSCVLAVHLSSLLMQY